MLTVTILFLRLTLAGLIAFPTLQAQDQAQQPPAQPEQPTAEAAKPEPTEAPITQPPATEPADNAAPADIANADDLLNALETAGQDTHRLAATVRYIKTFAIQGDQQQRDGRLVFQSDPAEDAGAPNRRFGITFDRLQVGDRIEDPSTGFLEQYIFDGEWLAEIRPLDKQFTRRQVVPPGERWDPLRLGEGPFPIPIQQKREDILSRFDAELLDGKQDVFERPLMGLAGRCYQLRLIPRADVDDQDLREIRVWYDKDTLLPRLAKTVNTADDESFVMLKDLATNADAEFSDADLSTEFPADSAGWSRTQEAFRE